MKRAEYMPFVFCLIWAFYSIDALGQDITVEYEFPGEQGASGIIPYNNGEFILYGDTELGNDDERNPLLIRILADGSVLDSRVIPIDDLNLQMTGLVYDGTNIYGTAWTNNTNDNENESYSFSYDYVNNQLNWVVHDPFQHYLDLNFIVYDGNQELLVTGSRRSGVDHFGINLVLDKTTGEVLDNVQREGHSNGTPNTDSYTSALIQNNDIFNVGRVDYLGASNHRGYRSSLTEFDVQGSTINYIDNNRYHTGLTNNARTYSSDIIESGGDYLISAFGNPSATGVGGYKAFLIKTSGTGQNSVSETFQYGMPAMVSFRTGSVVEHSTGTYLTMFSKGDNVDDLAYLVKLDAGYDVEWAYQIDLPGFDEELVNRFCNDQLLISNGYLYYVLHGQSAPGSEIALVGIDLTQSQPFNCIMVSEPDIVKEATTTHDYNDPLPNIVHEEETDPITHIVPAIANVISEPICCNLQTNIFTNHVTCSGWANGGFSVSVQNGTAPIQYHLGNATNTTGVFTNLTAGNYSIIISDGAGNICFEEVSILEPEPLLVQGDHVETSCFGSNDGSLAPVVSGGTAPYSYSWTSGVLSFPGSTSPSITGLSPGWYIVQVTDANGCSTTRAFQVTEPPLLELTSSAVIAESCSLNDGSISVSIAGGTEPYSYTLIGYNGPVSASADMGGLSGGIYALMVTDANGCAIGPFTFEVEEPVNCCPALFDPEYTAMNEHFGGDNTIDASDDLNSDGIISLSGKYFVDAPISVEDVILDVTNCDIVFRECAGLTFDSDASIRANNSVFRPCEYDRTWRGLEFESSSENVINECTFRNALIGASFESGGMAKLENNLFQNCKVAVMVTSGTNFEEPIAGNSIVFDQDNPDFDFEESCIDRSIGQNIGILLEQGSIVTGQIAQNRFINSHDEAALGFLATSDALGAKVSDNHFTDFQIGIAVDGIEGGNFTFENNHMEVSRILDLTGNAVGSAQILISNSQAFIHAQGNEVYSTYTDLLGVGFQGIELINSSNLTVMDNTIQGNFEVSILGESLQFSSVKSNIIEDFQSSGIYMTDISSVSIECNQIDGREYDAGIGILIQEYVDEVVIQSNCVYNTMDAIRLHSDVVRDGSDIRLRNNFLFNYSETGVNNFNYQSLEIGSGPNDPGMHTFWSNTDALDISSPNTTTHSRGNFGVSLVTTFDPLTQTGVIEASTPAIYSVASCGKQVMDEYQQQEFWTDQYTCEAEPDNWTIEFDVSTEAERLMSSETDIEHATNLFLRLYQEDEAKAMSFANELLSTNTMSQESGVILEFEVLKAEERYHDALSFLMDNEVLLEEDYVLVEGVRLALSLSTANSISLSDLEKEQLRQIASLRTSTSNTARSILMTHFGESSLYINEVEYTEPNYEAQTTMSLDGETSLSLYPNPTEDVLNIQVEVGELEKAEVIIYSAMGQIVTKQPVEFYAGALSIDVGHLAEGAYQITITDGKSFHATETFVKR